MTGPLTAGALLALVSSAVAACGDDSPSPVAIYSGPWHSDDGMLAGRMIRDGDCLQIITAEGEAWTIAFAEEGTLWADDAQSVEYLGATLHVGEHVIVGGSSPPGFEPEWVRPPSGDCDGLPVWLVGDPYPSPRR